MTPELQRPAEPLLHESQRAGNANEGGFILLVLPRRAEWHPLLPVGHTIFMRRLFLPVWARASGSMTARMCPGLKLRVRCRVALATGCLRDD